MKQQIVLIGLVLAMFTAFSQSSSNAPVKPAEPPKPPKPPKEKVEMGDVCPHRIWVDLGMGYSNNIYNRLNKFEPNLLNQKYAFTNMLEAGYAYFFHPKMGVGLGVGISRISAKAVLGTGGTIHVKNDEQYILDPEKPDLPADAYWYYMDFDCNNFAEKQGIWAIDIPLTFQFEHRMGENKRHGIFASLGVKGFFPIQARTKFEGGNIKIEGDDPYLNVHYLYTLTPHFGETTMGSRHVTAKMRPSVDIIGNFGGLINLTKSTDLYLGIYASYGFLDILPKEKVNYIEYSATTASSVNGMLNSNALESYNNDKRYDATVSEKWNLVQAGIKVGLRFNTCHQKRQSMREDMRDFLDKYDGTEKPVKPTKEEPKDDGKGRGKSEPVYIIPVYVGDMGNGGSPRKPGEDPNTGKDPVIDDLIQTLMDARIYFPLDQDIPINPRLAHIAVDKAVSILKANPNIKIIIEGFTCRLGTETHNQDLGQRRASTIRNMFIAKGADPKQIEIEAFTVANYPPEVRGTFITLEDARTVIFKIIRQK